MELLDLFNFIIEHFPRFIAPNLFIVAAAAWLVIKIKQLRHPRYSLRFITFAILVFLIFNAIILELTSIPENIALLALLAIYSLTAYLSSKNPILYSNGRLKSLRELLIVGHSMNNELLFEKKPFYLIDYVEKLQYLMLKSEHLRVLEKFADAYEVYQSIDERKLFDKERIDLLRKKAFILYSLGDMNKATYYLDRIKDESEPNYLMLKSMIAENDMDIEGASRYLQKALNLTSETKEPLLKAMIFNNYGRLRLMEGNNTDAISFYQQSYEIAKNQKNREILHVSSQNLIHTCLLKEDKDKGIHYFKEYEILLTDKTLFDLKEEFNLRVEIARQTQSNAEVSKVILDGYQEIRPLLTNQRQKVFDVSVLRMMFNNKMNFDIAMERIYDNIDEYFSFKMPEKYLVLKEINIPLREIRFPHCHKYALVNKRVSEYMKKDALKEINTYISELKDYEVLQRCNMEREHVWILKEWVKPYKFETIYNTMSDIKDIYNKNGMAIEAIFMDLDIADECFSPDNYFENEIKLVPKQKMKEHARLAADSLMKLKKYPRVVEGNIRLAVYYMVLNEKEKAQKHFEAFEEAKIPIRHFAFWIQRDYEGLCKEFKKTSVLEME